MIFAINFISFTYVFHLIMLLYIIISFFLLQLQHFIFFVINILRRNQKGAIMNSINKSKLFFNINDSEQQTMMKCFNSHLIKYMSGEILYFFSEANMGIGIVEEGNACIVYNFPNGSRTILEDLSAGDIFGDLFYYHSSKENISIEATSDCVIRYIDYEHLTKRCIKACAHHSQLVSNVLEMVQEKAQHICEHLEVLSQRSIRERILSYFSILSVKAGADTFELPFSITDLSDYLSVDRSAMSRELKKMKNDNLIKMNRRTVTLLFSE